MNFEEMFRDVFEKAVKAANDDFLLMHNRHVFRPMELSAKQITDGGNKFKVTLSFEPCEGAEAMPSAN